MAFHLVLYYLDGNGGLVHWPSLKYYIVLRLHIWLSHRLLILICFLVLLLRVEQQITTLSPRFVVGPRFIGPGCIDLFLRILGLGILSLQGLNILFGYENFHIFIKGAWIRLFVRALFYWLQHCSLQNIKFDLFLGKFFFLLLLPIKASGLLIRLIFLPVWLLIRLVSLPGSWKLSIRNALNLWVYVYVFPLIWCLIKPLLRCLIRFQLRSIIRLLLRCTPIFLVAVLLLCFCYVLKVVCFYKYSALISLEVGLSCYFLVLWRSNILHSPFRLRAEIV